MNIEELILSRRTIHDYKTEVVDESLIDQALLMATHAPNHRHTHPWRFAKLGPKARIKVADLAVEHKQKKSTEALSELKKSNIQSKFLNPAWLIVVGQKLTEDEYQRHEDYASVACGVQNAQLFLWHHKLGTKWSTGAVTRAAEVYDLIDWNPLDTEIVGFLWVGVPDRIPPKPPKPELKKVLKNTD